MKNIAKVMPSATRRKAPWISQNPKKQSVLIVILFLSSVIALGAVHFSHPQIELNATHFDFGDIDPNRGKRTETFTIDNTGQAPLEILAVSTSCGCTTATVGTTTIGPGEQTTLFVTYDPLAHGGAVGPIKRIVYVQSNDPQHEELELELVGNVLPASNIPQPVPQGESTVREDLQQSPYTTAAIYYNEACAMCAEYIHRELLPILENSGIQEIVTKDYINEKANRQELNSLNKAHMIPPNLHGHFMVFIDEKIILGGHVPKHIVVDLLTQKPQFDKLLILQDEMDDAKTYWAWGFKGEAREYAIETPIRDYIAWFNESKDMLPEPDQSDWSVLKLLSLVVGSGFLDGINPCAFSVLIFFVLFLFSVRKKTTHIILIGLLFIAMIFLAYMLIGLGIVHAFVLVGDKHLIAKISAGLMIVLGLVNIKDYFWYGKWFSLSPHISSDFYQRTLSTLTIPSVMIVGFLVGLCTFPCSGGIYVAILGVLAAKATYLSGLLYMVVYNVMFILPLLVMLFFLVNRRTLGLIARWENTNKRYLKLLMGTVMILIGIGLFAWVL